MIHETLIHQLTVKALSARLQLSPREVEILLLLHTSKSLSTPSIHTLLGMRKTEINRRIGPRLEQLGWLKHESVTHADKAGMPTNRWWLLKSKSEELTEIVSDARRTILQELGLVLEADSQWTATDVE